MHTTRVRLVGQIVAAHGAGAGLKFQTQGVLILEENSETEVPLYHSQGTKWPKSSPQ